MTTIVPTTEVVEAVQAKMIQTGNHDATKLEASNMVWRVVNQTVTDWPLRSQWRPIVQGLLLTVTRENGQDGPEAVVRLSK